MTTTDETPRTTTRLRSKSPALREYRERLNGLPASKFIGSVLWYTVAGQVERDAGGKRVSTPVRVHQDLFEEWFTELGIDPRFLPPRIKKIDAFRNASSSVRREYEVPGSNGSQIATLSVEEVKSDSEQVIRHVVRIIRDQKREQLSMEHMATIKFIRGGRTSKGKRHAGDHVKYQVLSRLRGDDRTRVQTLVDDFLDRYEDLSNHLHAPALRGVVRAILTSFNAVPMRASGGLYYVHKSRWPDLDSLQKLLAKIGQGCLLEDLPMLDTGEKRQVIQEALEAEVEDACNKLLVHMAEVNASSKGGKIPARKYAEINAAYNEVSNGYLEHVQLLELSQNKAARALELALDSMMEMARRLDVGAQLR